MQKILLKDCTVYNILFETNVLGHIISSGDSLFLIQTDELPIVPIAESFGFSGKAYLTIENTMDLVELNPASELKPLYEYKVVNLEDYSLKQLTT